jgi:hypothetical protein
MELKESYLDNSLAESWKLSEELYGSPKGFIVSDGMITDLDFGISPNPFRDLLNIKHDFEKETIIEIFDLTGKIIFRDIIHENNGAHIDTYSIQLGGLESGVYLIRLYNNKTSISQNIIKL